MRGVTQLNLSFYMLLTFAVIQSAMREPAAAWTLFGCANIVCALRLVLIELERR